VARVGSLRRKQDTIGDLNFLVETKQPATIFARVRKFGAVESWKKETSTRASFRFASGGSMTVACTSPQNWGLALMQETGSAEHLRELSAQVRHGKASLAGSSLRAAGVEASSEREVYRALGLPFIEPKLREGRGEIEAARRGKLPRLIERKDIRGDLHMHTTASDGAQSISEMADAACSRGYEYIAITDHSQSLKLTNGLSERRLLQQIKHIDRLNARCKGSFVILKSAEVDILEDGRLDYPDAILKELDCTICSIHSRFALGREQQTERIMPRDG